MTLRTRLVVALLALTAVGLAAFGLATYSLYGRSLQRQLDDDLLQNARGQAGRLALASQRFEFDPSTCAVVGAGGPEPGGPEPGGRAGGAPGLGLDAYAELRDRSGTVTACSLPVTTDGLPDLPDDLPRPGRGAATYLTVGSVEGSGEWRVLVSDEPAGRTTIVLAVRTDGIAESLGRLVRIEAGAAVALLTLLGVGSWLLLRRELQPLEHMADEAASINAGDLSRRVEPSGDRTEVGQLGLALNTMLDGIEGSFREREATEAKLRQFLADASHELRTPLTSILGYAELFRLSDDAGRTPELDLPVVMGRIEQESNRMRVLVEDLLLLARLDEPQAGAQPRASEPVDLALIAAEACASATASTDGHPLTFDAPAPVVVDGVADQLHRAIANLVANAVKHTPAGTAIEVSVRREGDRAAVVVRDHGPGLAADAIGHVFERFWQADRARVGAGSGLGLAIVAGIAEAHGGSARAEQAPGGGARFVVDLPAQLPGGSSGGGDGQAVG